MPPRIEGELDVETGFFRPSEGGLDKVQPEQVTADEGHRVIREMSDLYMAGKVPADFDQSTDTLVDFLAQEARGKGEDETAEKLTTSYHRHKENEDAGKRAIIVRGLYKLASEKEAESEALRGGKTNVGTSSSVGHGKDESVRIHKPPQVSEAGGGPESPSRGRTGGGESSPPGADARGPERRGSAPPPGGAGGRTGPERGEREPLDAVRERLLVELTHRLYADLQSAHPVTVDELDQIMTRIHAPEVFRREAVAMMRMMNASAAKDYFNDIANMSKFDKKNEELMPDMRPILWKEAFLKGYGDDVLKVLVLNLERTREPGVSDAMKTYMDIFDYAQRVSDLEKSDFPDKQEQINALLAGFHPNVVDIIRNVFATNRVLTYDLSDRLVASVATQLGINKYDARVAFGFFEGLAEADVNSRHFLYSVTHSRDWAHSAKNLGFWSGSYYWWEVGDNPQMAGDPNFGGHVEGVWNGLPDHLWIAPVKYYKDERSGGYILDVAFRRGDGVSGLRRMLGDTRYRQDVLKLKADEGVAAKVYGRVEKAKMVMKSSQSISRSTIGADLNADVLEGLSGDLALLSYSSKLMDSDDVYSTLAAASLVLIREVRALNENLAIVEKGSPRVVDPYKLWHLQARLAMKRRFMLGTRNVESSIMDVYYPSRTDTVERVLRATRSEILTNIALYYRNKFNLSERRERTPMNEAIRDNAEELLPTKVTEFSELDRKLNNRVKGFVLENLTGRAQEAQLKRRTRVNGWIDKNVPGVLKGLVKTMYRYMD